jgi:hypothetical protein
VQQLLAISKRDAKLLEVTFREKPRGFEVDVIFSKGLRILRAVLASA